MSGMPIPDWARGAGEQIAKAHGDIDYDESGVEVRKLAKILDFSGLFAEYEERDDTLLIHLFPRGGGDDRFYPTSVNDSGTRIPGRLELSYRDIQFPEDIEDRIKAASDAVWMGEVAIEKIEVLRFEEDDDVEFAELTEVNTGSYVVQFQGVKTTSHLIGVPKFVDTFCEKLDELLDRDSGSENQNQDTPAP